ncbi:hypothetical protein L1049_002658 [Liquidambar formosana]|uniref:Uncharacterized protein n=1 Tax=Liquidambar formosana TaxID=63359 RepID=A0AAP0NHU5_LIQFO
MALESAGNEDPNGGSQLIGYGPILECLKRRALVRGISEWFPHPLRAGIVISSKQLELQENSSLGAF